MDRTESNLPSIINKYRNDLLADWLREQLSASTYRANLISEAELRQQSNEFLELFREAAQSGNLTDIMGREWARVREMLGSISRSRAIQGFTPAETATFAFSLKQPIFARLNNELGDDSKALVQEIWRTNTLLDSLGLYTIEVYQKGREELIKRQQEEMLELSTPVVKLWQDILALPLIGTLDSNRTQIVMENLLQRIVETNSSIVIIDITGVPTVDTLVAQHLIKTVAAARLMGTECIISGIRPQIAQTMVHLGVTLEDMLTKATLADAFLLALKKTGFVISRPKSQE